LASSPAGAASEAPQNSGGSSGTAESVDTPSVVSQPVDPVPARVSEKKAAEGDSLNVLSVVGPVLLRRFGPYVAGLIVLLVVIALIRD
jgi:hypothetical protein